jgi:hypothetical protein
MIEEKPPKTWKDLENVCGKILSECGLKSEVEKNIVLACDARLGFLLTFCLQFRGVGTSKTHQTHYQHPRFIKLVPVVGLGQK